MNSLIKNLQLTHLQKITPQDLYAINEGENLYKLVLVVGTRANRIAADLQSELKNKLRDFETFGEGEEFRDNEEQTEISRLYEYVPHPTLLALNELKEKELEYKPKSELDEENLSYLHERQLKTKSSGK